AYSVDNSLLFVLLYVVFFFIFFFFSSRRRHTSFKCDWSSDVCSSDLPRSPSELRLHACWRRRRVEQLRDCEPFGRHHRRRRATIRAGSAPERPFSRGGQSAVRRTEIGRAHV